MLPSTTNYKNIPNAYCTAITMLTFLILLVNFFSCFLMSDRYLSQPGDKYHLTYPNDTKNIKTDGIFL